MNTKLRFFLGLTTICISIPALAQITFYEGEHFHGRSFSTNKQVNNFDRIGFNDRASSVVIDRGAWEVCEDAGLHGHCMVLRVGSYDSLRGMGLENRISSVRPVADSGRFDNEAPAPLSAPNYEYRRRPDERIFEARVTSVRAVLGTPDRRCWVERQRVSEPARNESNVGGSIAGAIIGGVLGHQVGGGNGRDIATAGGAVAGAVLGSKVGQDNGGTTYDRDIRHCENTDSGKPEYWDVTYEFRGIEHHVQMTAPPGATIAVNRNGDPRQ